MKLAGVFISFEGIDGCGKTTQATLLAQRLVAACREVVVTHEPGGTGLGKVLRPLILGERLEADSHDSQEVLSWETEVLLLAADRAQHVTRVIKPALERGAVVICDRYVDSSLAYQGCAGESAAQKVWDVNEVATQGVLPELTILLALPPEQQYRRLETGDRIERRGIEYQQRVYDCFLGLARKHPRIVVLNVADKSRSEVAEMVWNTCLDRVPGLATAGLRTN